MQLTHKIRIDTTCKQREYFSRAAGTHRFCFNWALEEWNRQYAAGLKPTAYALRKQFNALYKKEFPWVGEVHRDCHSQPFADLQTAYGNFFAKRANKPAFKSKHKSRKSFYVANDKFDIEGKVCRLPVIGKVRLREELRFSGKISCARVAEDAGEWYLCVVVDVGDSNRERTGDGIVGVDLGIKTLATLSTGEVFENPKPLRKAQKRLRRAQRKVSRRVKGSKNRTKQKRVVARIHARVTRIRRDTIHKMTSKVCRENQTVAIEDLNVKGMVKNHCLAQAVSDAAFRECRRQVEYKSILYGGNVVVADRFFPSSKRCSNCGAIKETLSLRERVYVCDCGLRLDRDSNASRNLEQCARLQIPGASGKSTTTDTHESG